MTEEWKPVKGFEGWYEISNLGRVKSVEMEITHSCGKKQMKKEKIKKLQIHKTKGSDYHHVQLFKNSKHFKRYVHRMVAEAFIPNPENKPQVNHIDGDGTNNRVDNLEWVTPLENVRHAWDSGSFNKRLKKVRRISVEGKVKDFLSVKEAAASVGANYGMSVSQACRKGSKYKGYFWTFI